MATPKRRAPSNSGVAKESDGALLFKELERLRQREVDLITKQLEARSVADDAKAKAQEVISEQNSIIEALCHEQELNKIKLNRARTLIKPLIGEANNCNWWSPLESLTTN